MILIGLSPEEVESLERCVPAATLVAVPTLEDAVAWLEEAVRAVDVQSGPSVVDGLTIDPTLHRVTWQGSDVPVTEQELNILACLAAEPDLPRSFGELYEYA
jgi:DNA-binding response OmpR family regulator